MNSETFYLNILYNRGNVRSNLSQYLKTNNGSGYLKSLKACFSKQDFKDLLVNYSLYPKKFGITICSLLNLERLSVEKISVFFSALFNLEKGQIKDFLEYKNEFEHNVLVKKYDLACEILNLVYRKFGLSLWLIDSVSIMFALDRDLVHTKEDLYELKDNTYFPLFALKNNKNTKHNYYVNQMEELFNELEFDGGFKNYLKYMLFITVPKTDSEWKDIFTFAADLSLIDMYLCTIDFLDCINCNNKTKSIYAICKNNLRDINENKTIESNKQANIGTKCIDYFDSSNFNQLINLFYSNDFRSYDSISVYILTSIAHILSDISPESMSSALYSVIIELMYTILKRNEHNAISAIFRLATLARLLKSFDIHKGICVFLKLVANYDFRYNTQKMYSTVIDIEFKKYIEHSKNLNILPFATKIIKFDDGIVKNYLNLYKNHDLPNYNDKAENYYREAFVSLSFEKLVEQNSVDKATNLLVNAYIENKLLVYTIDVSPIIKYILEKNEKKENLSLEELCYIFIDSNMNTIRDDSFLDLFDEYSGQFPIDIVNQIYADDKIKQYFLYEICNAQRLSTVYLLFLSSEESENYRLKILYYLLETATYDKKILMDEIEDITKKRALSKKLKKIDESKLIINADFLRKNCYDSIAEKVDIFNNTSPFTLKIETDSNNEKIIRLIDNRMIIFESLYSIYCKEFCFGNFGIDISLSTRVRHGTLTNQLLKVFSDNSLVFDGHGKNEYFNTYFLSNKLDGKAMSVFNDFYTKINDTLDYFVKNTLKVFVDTPIDGAIFDYRYNSNDNTKIFRDLKSTQRLSADETIQLINHYMIEKTNEYLLLIRSKKIKELEDAIIKELNTLLSELKKYYKDTSIEKDIERKIITCKTDVQNELKRIANWFVLSEYNDWKPFDFYELIQTCTEIDKNLFSGFEKVCVNVSDDVNTKIKGMYFRELVDIILIIFNNAISHSGYKENLSELLISCNLSEDTNNYYVSFSNNLNECIEITELDTTIKRINMDFKCRKFLELNIRQEGGMGLYKIMHIMFSMNQQNDGFYLSRDNNIFRIELKFSKEIAE